MSAHGRASVTAGSVSGPGIPPAVAPAAPASVEGLGEGVSLSKVPLSLHPKLPSPRHVFTSTAEEGPPWGSREQVSEGLPSGITLGHKWGDSRAPRTEYGLQSVALWIQRRAVTRAKLYSTVRA